MTKNMIKIQLNSLDDVHYLVKASTKYSCDIDAIKGSMIVDCKSILGVSSLDWSKPLYVQLHTNNERLIYNLKEDIKQYIVEGV